MKKLFLSIAILVVAVCAKAQFVVDPGMETWRTNTTGSTAIKTIHAPFGWYSFDSLAIADGEALATLIGAGTNWHAQLFPDTTIVHSGTYSAKMITLKQDTLGYFAGSMSNTQAAVNLSVLLSGGSLARATTFSGGTPVAGKIVSVSAWVKYKPGVDSLGNPGADTGILTVQAINGSNFGGYDSVVGTGTVKIDSTMTTGSAGAWKKVTATIVYVDSLNKPDTIRINFASSGGRGSLDSSTLWVDDVTTIDKVGVETVIIGSNVVNVYPNPASTQLNLDINDTKTYNFTLVSINGNTVLSKAICSKQSLDISALPTGIYFYTISNVNAIVKKGKLNIVR